METTVQEIMIHIATNELEEIRQYLLGMDNSKGLSQAADRIGEVIKYLGKVNP